MPITSDIDRPRVLTVQEAAATLRIGRTTAYRAVADGAIPSVRIGSCIRVPSEALEDLLVRGPRHEPAARPAERRSPEGIDVSDFEAVERVGAEDGDIPV